MVKKDYLYDMIGGGFYRYHLYKVTDARRQEYYICEPVNRGGTIISNSVEEIQAKIDWQAVVLNSFDKHIMGSSK